MKSLKNKHLRLLISTVNSSTIIHNNLADLVITKFAAKQINKLPENIGKKVDSWIHLIQINGLERVRKISGFHDEQLKGDREGQRSIRLNRSWRLIYNRPRGKQT